MKFFVVLAFCLAVASATPFPQEINPRNLSVDTIEDSLIANGKTASKGQFPYQVGLVLNMGRGLSAFCGGSLIGQEWILTAAHCVNGAQKITAHFGGGVTRSIGKSNMVIHDDWDMQKNKNDIALLNIFSVPLDSNIQTVKLPAAGPTNSYVNSYAIVSGWGRMGDSAKGQATNLQYGRVKVVENSECSSYYGGFWRAAIGPNTLCVATPDHVSPCQGDSGGPLVLESGDKAGFKVQIGIVAFGSETGCEKGHPFVFTRVSSYLDWIKEYSGVHP